jgi:hypothetical protein
MEYIDPFKVVKATVETKDYSLEIAIAAIAIITVAVVVYELTKEDKVISKK